jgi:hypothetical protein
LCVGMPKAGTGWLFDQLKNHPDFWLPPVKEVSYLNHGFPRLARSSRLLDKKREKLQRASAKKGRRSAVKRRDLAFLQAATDCSGLARDLSRYASLFQFKDNLKSGDITPSYSLLDANLIEQIAARFPAIRIIFLVRDPIARAWSHICMACRDGSLNIGLMEQPVKFREYLMKRDVLLGSSMATEIVSRWRAAAPSIRFRHFFFDDIVAEPETVRRDILLYLGADPDENIGKLPAGFNRKDGLPKLVMSDDIKTELIDCLGDEVRACAEFFGGPARNWPAIYGL